MNGKTVAHASLTIAKAKLDKYVDVPLQGTPGGTSL
jgi:hypothetical protein